MEEGSGETAMSDEFPRSSRILVLSPTGVQLPSLQQFVSSITEERLADEPDAKRFTPEDPLDDEDGASSFHTTRRELKQANDSPTASYIPWTIDNRYYTAQVHFRSIALELPLTETRRTRSKASTDAVAVTPDKQLSNLRSELQDVQSVVIVMPGGLPLPAHKKMLEHLEATTRSGTEDEQETMPIGFALSVSTVICLPHVQTFEQTEAGRRQQPSPAKQDELMDLYAESGWEYIDLGSGDNKTGSIGLQNYDGDDGDSQNSSKGDEDSVISADDDGEPQGLSRVREALEANAWPGLIRKGPTGHQRLVDEVNPPATRPAQDDNDEVEAMFRKLDLNLPSLPTALGDDSLDLSASSNAAVHVEPTAEDADLAARFLESISAFEAASSSAGQDSSTMPETEAERSRKQAEALKRLEDFLEDEDAGWPQAAESSRSGTAEHLPSSSAEKATTSGNFDDDFDAFVTASSSSAGIMPPKEAFTESQLQIAARMNADGIDSNAAAWPSPDGQVVDSTEADLGFSSFPSHVSLFPMDDEDGEDNLGSSLNALEPSMNAPNFGGSSSVEATLNAERARIRGIADKAERDQEAQRLVQKLLRDFEAMEPPP